MVEMDGMAELHKIRMQKVIGKFNETFGSD